MSVTLRQLDAFRHALHQGTTRSVADTMGLTQSAIVRILGQLEDRLGFRVFHRHLGRLRVTDRGGPIGQIAQRVMENYDQVEAIAKNQTSLSHSNLRIGVLTTLGPILVPRAIASVRERFGTLRFSIDVAKQRELEEGVKVGRYDVALVSLPTFTDNHTVEPLGALKRACIVPLGHRLAAYDVITPPDLAGEHYISIHAGSTVRHATDKLFEEFGVARLLMTDARSTAMTCSMVAHGAGVSIVTQRYAERWSKKLAIRPFEPGFDNEFGILRSSASPLSQVGQEFVSAVRSVVRDF